MGHALARELNVTPWEALLGEVRRCAGAVAWLDEKVASAVDDAQLVEGDLAPWVRMRERERDRLVRAAKMALDAGIAAQYVRAVELEAQTTARVLLGVLNGLLEEGLLQEGDMVRARALMRRELIAIEGGKDGHEAGAPGPGAQAA